MASGDAPKQNHDNPISESNTTENRNNATLKILIAAIQVIESAIHAYQAQQHENARRERKKFWIQLLTLAAVGVYVGLTLLIWREMVGTGRQTDKLIQETIRQSIAAQDSAEAAKKAIEVTQENIRLEQRAWVGAIGRVRPDFRVGSIPKFGVTIANTGRTPALKVTSRMIALSMPKDQKFSPTYPTTGTKERGISLLQPGMQVDIVEPGHREVTQKEIDAFRNETRVMYLYGTIFYEDIFKRSHYSQFCMIMARDFSTVRSCGTHADAN